MKINLPINNFKLIDNKVFVNDLVVEYEDISEDTREILESLISKGAYGSALLTLNMFYNVKAFNEADYSNEDYLSYLGECNKLLKECVVEIDEAHNYKPLINLNGLEIMENAENIARGKGDKMLVEDFRKGEVLQERYLKSAKYGSPVWHTYEVNGNTYEFRCTYWETRGGWGHNVVLSMNYDQLADVDVRYYNRTWEMWEFQTAMQEACRKAMKTHKELESELQQVYDQIQEGSKGKSSEMRRTTISEGVNSFNSDEIRKYLNKGYVVVLSKSGYTPTSFIIINDEVCFNNKEISFGWNTHPTMKTIDDLLAYLEKMANEGFSITHRVTESNNLSEEAEGTQASDIAPKKDQSVGSLQKPKKMKKLVDKSEEIMKEMKSVPRNHGFKGFMLDESGFYTRGNYVLIKEGKTIKAINRKSFEKRDYIENK